MALNITNPKRRRTAEGWADLFPYYAGYPETFASDLLASAGLREGARIFDPWNGSGSTTSAAASLGMTATGYDLNPVMVVVAKAKLLPRSEWTALRPLSKRIIQYARIELKSVTNDPLHQWFDDRTTGFIRALEGSVRAHLIDRSTVDELSTLASVFYVALFSTVRELARPFRSSNPTWLKAARSAEERLAVSRNEIERNFYDAIDRARESCKDGSLSPECSAIVRLQCANSTYVRPRKGSIDFVLTSPPYCTRLDYTAATRVELAVLSPIAAVSRSELSLGMLGSIRVPKRRVVRRPAWGKEALRLLAHVRSHDSHASDTYYYQTHLDYFSKLERSLRNCAEALRPSGRLALVVQDSYYKGERNDLQLIVTEMMESMGLSLDQRADFASSRSMRHINSRSKAYGGRSGVTESVLVFGNG
jgi:SAM-dependent methyltransferase